jgi:hypothetical protein
MVVQFLFRVPVVCWEWPARLQETLAGLLRPDPGWLDCEVLKRVAAAAGWLRSEDGEVWFRWRQMLGGCWGPKTLGIDRKAEDKDLWSGDGGIRVTSNGICQRGDVKLV